VTAVQIARYFLTAFHSPFAPSTILLIYVVVHMPILPFKLCDATAASITTARKGKLGLCPEIPSLVNWPALFLGFISCNQFLEQKDGTIELELHCLCRSHPLAV